MAELNSTMDGAVYDELIGGTTISLSTKVVTLAAGAAPMKRGTLLGMLTKEGDANKGKYKIVDASKDDGTQFADCVLARDVGARLAAINAEAYRSGEFNRQKLIVSESDTPDAHEEELRAKNIIMTSLY